MKGLFEWKILAALFAILIVTSSALVSNSGVKDMFLNSTGSLGDWMDGAPFGSLFTTPEKTTTEVVIKLQARSIELEMSSPVNITANSSSIKNFKGMLGVNLARNTTSLSYAESDFELDLNLRDVLITDVRITSLVLDDMNFVVSSDKTNISATNDKLEIYDFYGDIRISDVVELSGNVSRVKSGAWTIG